MGTVYDHLSWVLFRAMIKLQISIYKVTFIPNPNKAIVRSNRRPSFDFVPEQDFKFLDIFLDLES